jgi:cell division protein ZapA
MNSGSPDKKQVRVTIFNQTYSLRTAGDEGATEQLAHSVDELMTSIAKRSGNIDSTRVAVLACLHLADQLRSLEADLEQLQSRITSKSRDFTVLLDRALKTE